MQYIPSIDETSGGVGAYMQIISRDLGMHCKLHVITHKTGNMRELENCNIHYIPFGLKNFFCVKKAFINILNEINPDVVHCNCCWTPYSAYTAIWAKAEGYKVVYTPHGMLEPWIMKRHYWTKKLPASLLFQKRGLQTADVIHATANSEKENLLKLGWNKDVAVIPNCVQVEKIIMKTSWKRKREILFLSRVHVKKGINFLIEAVAAIYNEYKTINEECPIDRCIIAGDGDVAYIHELRGMASRLGVNHIIDFIGGVYGELKWELFRQADLFVLPTHSENFGIVVAEALASGTPVITTKGTPWQELKEYRCGWWTEIGTKATTKAIREFLQCSDEQLEKMGKNGRRLVEEKYSSKKVAADMVRLYQYIKEGDTTGQARP